MSGVESATEHIVQQLRRHTLVFLHAGCVYPTEDILSAVSEAYDAAALTIHTADVLSGPVGPPPSTDLLVLPSMERLIRSPSRCETLSNLRASVMPLVEGGLRVLILSAAPKRRLQGCPGSSLIIDAAPVFISAYGEVEVGQLGQRLSEEERRDLWAYSQGLPILFETVSAAIRSSAQLPRQERVIAIKQPVYEVLCAAIAEAGPEFASILDHYVTELKLYTVDCADVDAAVVEGWRGAGFGISHDGWITAELFPGSLRPLWTSALRDYVDSTLDVPNAWETVSRGLWEIERRVREAVRMRAEQKGGKGWRASALSPVLAARALDRAQADAFPASTEPKDLPNPFEWVSLAEVIQTIEEHEWARPAGVPLIFWKRLQAELSPVRNRVAHMRLLGPGDGDIVRRWLNQVRRHLP